MGRKDRACDTCSMMGRTIKTSPPDFHSAHKHSAHKHSGETHRRGPAAAKAHAPQGAAGCDLSARRVAVVSLFASPTLGSQIKVFMLLCYSSSYVLEATGMGYCQ